MFTRDACIGAASLYLAVLTLTAGALAQDTTHFGFGSPGNAARTREVPCDPA